MQGLPFGKRHAINAFTGLFLAELKPALGGGILLPLRQAIAAETGQDHQIDILGIRPVLHQMLQQAAEGGGFQFGLQSCFGHGFHCLVTR